MDGIDSSDLSTANQTTGAISDLGPKKLDEFSKKMHVNISYSCKFSSHLTSQA
jgi:hypothetical protein